MPEYSSEKILSNDAPSWAKAAVEGAEPEAETGQTSSTRRMLSPRQVKALKNRLKLSLKYYETNFKPQYEACLKLMKGDHFADMTEDVGEHQVVVNYINFIVRTKYAALTFKHPEWIVQPESPLGEENADTARLAGAYEFRKSKAFREAKRALFESLWCDLGIVKTGWLFKTETVTLTDGRLPVVEETGEYTEGESAYVDEEPVARAEVVKDEFYCRRIDPRHFLADPAGSWVLDEHRWCGYREWRPLEEVKRDKRYKNTRQLKGSTKPTEDYLPEEQRELAEKDRDADCKWVELWHYYERDRRIYCCFSAEHDQPLIAPELDNWEWDEDRYPFRIIYGPKLETDFYSSTPQLLMWKSMQMEINHTRSAVHTHRLRFVPKLLAWAGLFNTKGRAQVKSGKQGTIVEVPQGTDLGNAVAPFPYSPITGDFYNADKMAEQDLMRLSTLDQYALGTAPTKRMTQDEVAALQGAGGAIREDDQHAWEEFLAGIMEDCVDWLQQYAVLTRALPIYKEGQPPAWLPWTREQIQGDFDFQVDVGSTTLMNRQGKVEQIGFLFQTLAPLIQAGMLNGQELARQLLQNLEGIKNVEMIVQTPPPMGAPPALQTPSPGGAPDEFPPGTPPEAIPMNGNGAAPLDPLAMMGGM